MTRDSNILEIDPNIIRNILDRPFDNSVYNGDVDYNKAVAEDLKDYGITMDENGVGLNYPLDELIAQNNTYFNLKHLSDIKPIGREIFAGCSIIIINLPKNVGKTYGMRMICNEMTENAIRLKHQDPLATADKFVLIFRNERTRRVLQGEINGDPNFKYKIQGQRILSKGYCKEVYNEKTDTYKTVGYDHNIEVGMICEFDTMHNYSSMQGENVTITFGDEYMTKIKLDKTRAEREVPNGNILQSNIQRAKDDMKFILFGNNEPSADMIAEFYQIDDTARYLINVARRLIVIKDPRIGRGKDRQKGKNHGKVQTAQRNADLSESTNRFFKLNEKRAPKNGMIPQKDFRTTIEQWGYIKYDTMVFKGIFFEYKGERVLGFESREVVTGEHRKDNLVTVAYNVPDYLSHANIKEGNVRSVFKLARLYKAGKIKFGKQGDRDMFLMFLHATLPAYEFQKHFGNLD